MRFGFTMLWIVIGVFSVVAGEIGLKIGPKTERLNDGVRIRFEVSPPLLLSAVDVAWAAEPRAHRQEIFTYRTSQGVVFCKESWENSMSRQYKERTHV